MRADSQDLGAAPAMRQRPSTLSVLLVITAALAGPLYGMLGQRWRVHRSLLSALLAVSPLLLEPVSRFLRLESGQPLAYYAEVAVGLLAACYFALSRTYRQPAER